MLHGLSNKQIEHIAFVLSRIDIKLFKEQRHDLYKTIQDLDLKQDPKRFSLEGLQNLLDTIYDTLDPV